MSKLGLQETLRAGVAPLGGGVDEALVSARELASRAPAGEVAVAGS